MTAPPVEIRMLRSARVLRRMRLAGELLRVPPDIAESLASVGLAERAGAFGAHPYASPADRAMRSYAARGFL